MRRPSALSPDTAGAANNRLSQHDLRIDFDEYKAAAQRKGQHRDANEFSMRRHDSAAPWRDRPTGDGVKVLIGKSQDRRHGFQLSALGYELGTRGLAVARFVPGPAL
jgi:hypothetical protein